jgi:hypothetical protein
MSVQTYPDAGTLVGLLQVQLGRLERSGAVRTDRGALLNFVGDVLRDAQREVHRGDRARAATLAEHAVFVLDRLRAAHDESDAEGLLRVGLGHAAAVLRGDDDESVRAGAEHCLWMLRDH